VHTTVTMCATVCVHVYVCAWCVRACVRVCVAHPCVRVRTCSCVCAHAHVRTFGHAHVSAYQAVHWGSRVHGGLNYKGVTLPSHPPTHTHTHTLTHTHLTGAVDSDLGDRAESANRDRRSHRGACQRWHETRGGRRLHVRHGGEFVRRKTDHPPSFPSKQRHYPVPSCCLDENPR
jgi:hypothetical protein